MEHKDMDSRALLKLLRRMDESYQPTEEERAALRSQTGLDLRYFYITALPESFGQLSALQTLDLRSTQITALPESFGQLSALQWLDLSSTQITALPESIGQLSALQTLYLYNTPITALPESFGQLSALQTLDLTCTKITALPESFGQLSALQRLELSNTRITKLPEWIGELPALQRLDLSGLTLPALPRSLALRGLPFYNRSSFSYNETGVFLSGAKLTRQNISIFFESPGLIQGLYEEAEQVALRESKLIFLGDGDSGKTYTIRRFQNQGKKEGQGVRYDTAQTSGVVIEDCDVERGTDSFRIHFWDFGGQELMHSMHRCFLTEETCYVVTVKSRETKATQRAAYWLRNVAAFAPKSPVLLYVNCWMNDRDSRYIDENSLRQDFPNIVDVVYCSAKKASDSAFRNKLMKPIIDMAANSEGCKRKVNRKWDRVRRAILEENRQRPYLTREQYHQLCAENGIEDENAADLLSFFNNLGVCFSYHRDKDRKELTDYKLLNPVWLTNAIYAVIQEGMDQAQGGRIKVSAIRRLLAGGMPKPSAQEPATRTMPELRYNTEECEYVLDVAAAHDLCYRVDGETLFFPALCSNNTPAELLAPPEGYPQHVIYQLKYPFLPDSVVHRLMIRCLRQELVISDCWLRGMVLGAMKLHRAVIRMENDDATLRVELWSKQEEHPAFELFRILREEIDAVNRLLELVPTAEEIVDGEDHYSVISLLSAARDNGAVYGPKTGKRKSARELLGSLYSPWLIRQMRVENGQILVPITPRSFHPCANSSPALRHALYEAYNHTCPYCNQPIKNIRDVQVDHILPTKYRELPELAEYVKYLAACGFDVRKPDYVENYFPTHGHCNRDRSNRVDPFTLFAYHERAFAQAPKVLALMKNYREAGK